MNYPRKKSPKLASKSISDTDSLIHIADLHFWQVVLNPFLLLNKRFLGNANVWYRRRHEFACQNAAGYSEEVARVGIQPVLLTGDFTSTATEAEFEMGAGFIRGLEEAGLEPIAIAGNHDVYTFESVRARRFEHYLGAWSAGESLPRRKDLPGGTPLVFVPTVCPNLLSSRGRISASDVEAVEALVRDCPSPLIVAGHYPVLRKTYAYRTTSSRDLRNAEALREVLGASGKRILYVAGHVHRFSATQDTKYPGLSHLTTGTFFGRNEREGVQGEFAEICVDGEEFRVIRHTRNGGWEARAESFQ